MPSVAKCLTLPYTPEQMFDLVADVERYPAFLPWWRAARVRRRQGERLIVEQLIGHYGLRWRFTTQTRLERPRRIRVTSQDAPLRHLVILWCFAPATGGGCRVSFRARYELRRLPLRRLAARLFDDVLRQVVTAFEARAHAVYGGRDAAR